MTSWLCLLSLAHEKNNTGGYGDKGNEDDAHNSHCPVDNSTIETEEFDRPLREFEVKMFEKETFFIFPVFFSPKRTDIHTNGQTLQLTS